MDGRNSLRDKQKCKMFPNNNHVLWMDEIQHHFETTGNTLKPWKPLLVGNRAIASFQGFLGGGFCPQCHKGQGGCLGTPLSCQLPKPQFWELRSRLRFGLASELMGDSGILKTSFALGGPLCPSNWWFRLDVRGSFAFYPQGPSGRGSNPQTHPSRQ